MIFRRKIYKQMLTWKNEEKGRSALLIQGARRVGKSTIVEAFARQEYKSYILIDFSRASQNTRALFDDTSDLNYIFLQLQLTYRVDLHERESVIIFDEVQLCPKARQAIKHLIKDHRYDYIETGSLLSIRQNIKDILIPSEEHRINMFPLDYEEFLWATGDTVTFPLLQQVWAAKRPLGNAVHHQLMRNFRLYMLVGGMPQAVESYLATNNFRAVDTVKRQILDLYTDDFQRIDASGTSGQLFRAIPAQLSSNAARYQIAAAVPHAKRSHVAELVANMENSYTILLSYHANNPDVGMALTKNLDFYKMFLLDTGLFVTLVYGDKAFTDNDIYARLLSDKQHTDLGYLYDNMVAQMTAAKGDALYYYTFPTKSGAHNYEIDFLLTRHNKLCPIEVKSSSYKTHASLDAFYVKYSQRIGQRYLVYTKDLYKDTDILCLPIYLYPFV